MIGAERGLVQAELIAVLAAVAEDEPQVMTVGAGQALPSGPLVSTHRSLQASLRDWIERQTGHPVGFLEQLYTFADRDRALLDELDPGASAGESAGESPGDDAANWRISISYLGLVRQHPAPETPAPGTEQPEWHGWYEYFPWEDHRNRPPALLAQIIAALQGWAESDPAQRELRHQRLNHAFGLGSLSWNEDLVLQRYELMYEAGLVAEARRPRAALHAVSPSAPHAAFGRPMRGDHRRILATGIARLRAKIKYRPVAFELMPESFTFLRFQRSIEAIAGLRLHKSNFRRQIDQQDLLEETGETSSEAGGRPAMLYRYRPSILEARAMAGTRLPLARD